MDGDGLVNIHDEDLDGDGVDNVEDADDDGDGIVDEEDESSTGLGTSEDIDGDGVENGNDADIDGDGEANVLDADTDGDGEDNDVDEDDDDDDGVVDAEDESVTGLGTEDDLDGDGVENALDAVTEGLALQIDPNDISPSENEERPSPNLGVSPGSAERDVSVREGAGGGISDFSGRRGSVVLWGVLVGGLLFVLILGGFFLFMNKKDKSGAQVIVAPVQQVQQPTVQAVPSPIAAPAAVPPAVPSAPVGALLGFAGALLLIVLLASTFGGDRAQITGAALSEDLFAIPEAAPKDGVPIAGIDLRKWDEGRLAVAFLQDEQEFPVHCADGVQNKGEGGVDCGGICEVCSVERTTGVEYFDDLFLYLFWVLLAGTFVLYIWQEQSFLRLRVLGFWTEMKDRLS